MLVTRRAGKDFDVTQEVFNTKLEDRYLREKLTSRVTKGFHLQRKGRMLYIHFGDRSSERKTRYTIALTELEVFKMANWCRGDRSFKKFVDTLCRQSSDFQSEKVIRKYSRQIRDNSVIDDEDLIDNHYPDFGNFWQDPYDD